MRIVSQLIKFDINSLCCKEKACKRCCCSGAHPWAEFVMIATSCVRDEYREWILSCWRIVGIRLERLNRN